MIGLLFELIEWSIKLMIMAFVIAARLMIWLLRELVIAIAALAAAIAAARQAHESSRSA